MRRPSESVATVSSTEVSTYSCVGTYDVPT